MNQKEYELIAQVIYDCLPVKGIVGYSEAAYSTVEALAYQLADALEGYSSFDRKKFIKACGL